MASMKKKLPTQLEIKAEVKKLKKMKPFVRKQSVFGDDHHAAIDAQIRVLDERYVEDQIYEEYGGDGEDVVEENVLNAALDALHWKEGDDRTPPSKSWESLVKKP